MKIFEMMVWYLFLGVVPVTCFGANISQTGKLPLHLKQPERSVGSGFENIMPMYECLHPP